MNSISKRNQGKLKRRKGQGIFIFCMLIIPILNWLIFFLYLNFNSILIAFQDARTGAWTLKNFVAFWESFTSAEGDLKLAMINTLKYFIMLFVKAFACLWVAYFLYKRIAGHKVFRIIYYLPAIVSDVAMTTGFKVFIAPGGPWDSIISHFGKSVPIEGYLANPATATNTILIYCILTGFTTTVLLFCNAMERIPVDVLESAALDGCGLARELVQIIIPLIWSNIISVVILLFAGLLSSSGPILMFTEGKYGTMTISYWIFAQVYGNGMMGGSPSSANLVSCTGLCLTLMTFPVIMGVRKLLSRFSDVEY